MKNLSIILFVLIGTLCEAQNINLGMGVMTNKFTYSKPVITLNFNLEQLHMYIGSNLQLGEGSRVEDDYLEEAELNTKQLVSTFGLGWNFKVAQNLYIQPNIGGLFVHDVYQLGSDEWHTDKAATKLDLNLKLSYDIYKFSISTGTGTQSPFIFSIGYIID